MKSCIRLSAAILLLFIVCVILYQFCNIQQLSAFSQHSYGDKPQNSLPSFSPVSPRPTKSGIPSKRPAIHDLLPAQKPPSVQFTLDEGFRRDGVIVVGKLQSEDADWVTQELPDWQHAIYTVDDPDAPLRVVKNKGREANVYLQYIIDHYYKLPSTVVFLHGHRNSWHVEFLDQSNVQIIQQLNVDYVQQQGYVSLRCNWAPGCPDEVQPFREPRDEERETEHAFPEAWTYFFNGTDVPETIAAPCCAQFAVSKQQVLQRPLSDYVRYHRWLMETVWSDDTSGRVMEYMWHIIFGRDPVHCPSLKECYSQIYSLHNPIGDMWDPLFEIDELMW